MKNPIIKTYKNDDCQCIGITYYWELEMDDAKISGHKMCKTRELAFEAAKKWTEQHLPIGHSIEWKDPVFK